MSQSYDSKGELSPLQGARILAALEAVRTAATRTTSEQRAASATIRRQQAELEALQAVSQKVSARGRDVRDSLQLLRESVDGAKLTLLNAGLLGAPIGDPLGKVLVVVGDELRNLLARAVDALDEHTGLLAEMERDHERAVVDLVRITGSTRQATSALERSEEQSQLTTALLSEIHTDLSELFGTGREAVLVVAEQAK